MDLSEKLDSMDEPDLRDILGRVQAQMRDNLSELEWWLRAHALKGYLDKVLTDQRAALPETPPTAWLIEWIALSDSIVTPHEAALSALGAEHPTDAYERAYAIGHAAAARDSVGAYQSSN